MKTNGERSEDDRRCIKTNKTLDQSRSSETPSVKCFFIPLHASVYEFRSAWQKELDLPQEFAATVADKVGQTVELVNGLGEKWPVVLTSYDGILALGRGWETFVNENKIEELDVLVFRSIDSHLKVEVYSLFSEEKISSRPKSVASFFKPLIEDTWIHRLVLPPRISDTVEDKIGRETKLENALGERWTVKFSSSKDGVAFESGWKEFANHHNLENRDMLVFKGFNNGSLFKVEVYNGRTFCEKACRRSLIRAQQEVDRKGKRKIGFELPNVDLGKAVADKGAVSSKGTSSRPQETSNVNQVEAESPVHPIGPYTCLAVTSGKELVLPELPSLINKGDVDKKLLMTNSILMDEGGRLWPASYRIKTWRLSCSWDKFAAVNGVRAGDRFSFAAHGELQRTYKITVIRST